jgi:hypothetical protein
VKERTDESLRLEVQTDDSGGYRSPNNFADLHSQSPRLSAGSAIAQIDGGRSRYRQQQQEALIKRAKEAAEKCAAGATWSNWSP